jgi:hypothetical protein
LDRGDKIFVGAIAGVVVGAGVATTRRRRRALASAGGPGPLEPLESFEREQPRFLGEPCEQCGARAGVRERQGTRLEQHVVHGGQLLYPVLQDRKVFYTYLACRACGAPR